jgi:circadian clock protein KaiC
MNEMQYSNNISERKDILATNILGFDSLFSNGGIPKGNAIMIAGGPGTGKSILCRHICYNRISAGYNCMYVSFEETNERIIKSMKSFGWNVEQYIENGQFLIQKINPLDVLRMKFGSLGGSGTATELSYKIKPLIIPKDFNPDVIVVDSLSAIVAASISKEKNYRVYLQQLFSFFEETGSTSLFISETDPIPKRFSETGIEEFLADGIIVLYNVQNNQGRQNAIEVLKMRYCKHLKKIVAMQINEKGIEVDVNSQIHIDF